MSARSGMTALINDLRSLTFAGTADWTLGTAVFWDDDHLQKILDDNRTDFFEVELRPIPKTVSSTVVWLRYDAPFQNIETIASGTAIWNLTLSTGAQAGTADYSVDYTKGIVTFTADQGGTAWFMSGRFYNLNSAAADVWKAKAAYYAMSYDVKTDGHDLSRSQLYKQAKEQESLFRSAAGAYTVDILRGDE